MSKLWKKTTYHILGICGISTLVVQLLAGCANNTQHISVFPTTLTTIPGKAPVDNPIGVTAHKFLSEPITEGRLCVTLPTETVLDLNLGYHKSNLASSEDASCETETLFTSSSSTSSPTHFPTTTKIVFIKGLNTIYTKLFLLDVGGFDVGTNTLRVTHSGDATEIEQKTISKTDNIPKYSCAIYARVPQGMIITTTQKNSLSSPSTDRQDSHSTTTRETNDSALQHLCDIAHTVTNTELRLAPTQINTARCLTIDNH